MAAIREIATDNQASSTAWGLMANSGLPSIMVSPDVSNENVDVTDDDLRTMKRRLADSFTGDQAGSIAVMSGPFKVEKVSFSPNEMALDVDKLLDKTEEKANGLKNKYVDAKSKLENKYKKLLMNEASTAYLVYLANLPADHDKYDQMLNDELKFVDYLSDLIKFGIP